MAPVCGIMRRTMPAGVLNKAREWPRPPCFVHCLLEVTKGRAACEPCAHWKRLERSHTILKDMHKREDSYFHRLSDSLAISMPACLDACLCPEYQEELVNNPCDPCAACRKWTDAYLVAREMDYQLRYSEKVLEDNKTNFKLLKKSAKKVRAQLALRVVQPDSEKPKPKQPVVRSARRCNLFAPRVTKKFKRTYFYLRYRIPRRCQESAQDFVEKAAAAETKERLRLSQIRLDKGEYVTAEDMKKHRDLQREVERIFDLENDQFVSRACPLCPAENPIERVVYVGCGHVVCTPCALDIVEKAPVEGQKRCPQCRVRTTFRKIYEKTVGDDGLIEKSDEDESEDDEVEEEEEEDEEEEVVQEEAMDDIIEEEQEEEEHVQEIEEESEDESGSDEDEDEEEEDEEDWAARDAELERNLKNEEAKRAEEQRKKEAKLIEEQKKKEQEARVAKEAKEIAERTRLKERAAKEQKMMEEKARTLPRPAAAGPSSYLLEMTDEEKQRLKELETPAEKEARRAAKIVLKERKERKAQRALLREETARRLLAVQEAQAAARGQQKGQTERSQNGNNGQKQATICQPIEKFEGTEARKQNLQKPETDEGEGSPTKKMRSGK